jgi:predicted DsbA family dithiol-disulfide isomerase
MKLVVDVISDVICPWCYIGKRRLEKAIAALDRQHDVQVHWHPFQLNPTMPKEGIRHSLMWLLKLDWSVKLLRVCLPAMKV